MQKKAIAKLSSQWLGIHLTKMSLPTMGAALARFRFIAQLSLLNHFIPFDFLFFGQDLVNTGL